MSAAGSDHQHDEAGGRRPFDWFALLDIAVWAAVVVLVALAAEWAYGTFIRERIAHEASKHIARVNADKTTE